MALTFPLWPSRGRDAPELQSTLVNALGPAEDASAPSMDVAVAYPVHILSGDAYVHVRDGRLVVERPAIEPVERALEHVSALHVHGWAHVTGGAISQLLAAGAPVVWRGLHGYPVGLTLPLSGPGLETRRAQYAAAADTARRLGIARTLVRAKIVGMRGVLRRRLRHASRGDLARLRGFAAKAQHAASITELLGVEGAATALYFARWPDLLRHRAEGAAFPGRSRRPPRNAVNALLSYLYAILLGDCVCAAAAAGLDPREGFLHEARPGRASLALDLLEPLRSTLADTAVLMALNTGEVSEPHFVAENGGVHLTADGRRAAVAALERRLATTTTPDAQAAPVTWREVIGLEAQRLAAALRSGSLFDAEARG